MEANNCNSNLCHVITHFSIKLGEDHETVLYHGDDVVVYKPPAKEEEEDEKFYEVEVNRDLLFNHVSKSLSC